MKRPIHLLCIFMLPYAMFGQTVLIDENFDAYNEGDLVAQTVGLPWSTWNNQPGGTYDSQLSSEQASSGTLSLRMISTTTAGGPGDVMLRLGDRTSGAYEVSWNMFIPPGMGGYFNLQHFEVIGSGSWIIEVTFLSNGTIDLSVNATPQNNTYPQGQWFQVKALVDLDAAQGTLYVNNNVVTTWSMMTNSQNMAGINQLGGVNFYAAGGGSLALYYVDDVLFQEIFNVGIQEASNGPLNVYPNPATDILNVELPAGTQPVVDLLDLTGRMVINATTAATSTVNGLTRLDLSGLPQGVYFLRVRNDGEEHVNRVVKN